MRLSIASSLVLASGLGLAGPAVAQQYGYDPYDDHGSGGIVRCESDDGRTRECPVDTRGGVRLVRQLSRTPCSEGRNWGHGRRGIWVSQGCRAEFAVGYGGGRAGGGWNDGSGAQLLRCGSPDGRTRRCAVDPRGGVRIVRQLSRSPCVEGRTWGVDRGGVWVSQGCRAEFEVGYRGNRGYGWGRDDDGRHGSGQLVRCESNDGRGRRCDLGSVRRVQLLRQLSRSACTEGHSWGWDRRGIWVDHGCRGEFSVR